MLSQDDLNMKFEYLNIRHDVLDHRNWHLRVFDPPLAMAIAYLEEAFFDGNPIYGLNKAIQDTHHLPELEKLLLDAGFTKKATGRGKYSFSYEIPPYVKPRRVF
ncbi:MAG: hypothetical protein JRN62_03155 [Nitrososphaerota archaeon]|jgi:hypothetical protein|nr:hypothetical protein [Nitrososphaerota archaeon]MDG6948595.1 hypothetical protein [Nitrososphaerota archaeon]